MKKNVYIVETGNLIWIYLGNKFKVFYKQRTDIYFWLFLDGFRASLEQINSMLSKCALWQTFPKFSGIRIFFSNFSYCCSFINFDLHYFSLLILHWILSLFFRKKKQSFVWKLTLDWDRRGSLNKLRLFVVVVPVVYRFAGGGGGGGKVSKFTKI